MGAHTGSKQQLDLEVFGLVKPLMQPTLASDGVLAKGVLMEVIIHGSEVVSVVQAQVCWIAEIGLQEVKEVMVQLMAVAVVVRQLPIWVQKY